nr:MAG TPA: hypothetical protein [Caudoviricetes sp.]
MSIKKWIIVFFAPKIHTIQPPSIYNIIITHFCFFVNKKMDKTSKYCKYVKKLSF